MKKLFLILFVYLSIGLSAQSNYFFFGQNYLYQQVLVDLVSVWEMDETSGTTMTDANSTNNGTITGADVDSTGILNKAYKYNGTSDYVSVPDADVFSFTDGSGNDEPFSISLWVYPTSSGQETFISKLNEYSCFFGASNNIVLRINSSANPAIYIQASSANSALTTNAWNFIVFTYDGSETEDGIKVYINGSDCTSTTGFVGSYVGMSNTANDLKFGVFSTINWLTGKIDQVSIWNKELVQMEVGYLWNYGVGRYYVNWSI